MRDKGDQPSWNGNNIGNEKEGMTKDVAQTKAVEHDNGIKTPTEDVWL